MPEAKPDPSMNHSGICVHCRRLLPLASFRNDAAGRTTSWCEPCRQETARKWAIDEDMVEIVYAVWVYEQGLRTEAGVAGAGRPNLAERIRNHDRNKLHRIPSRVRDFLSSYREHWFFAIGEPVPVAQALPAAVAG